MLMEFFKRILWLELLDYLKDFILTPFAYHEQVLIDSIDHLYCKINKIKTDVTSFATLFRTLLLIECVLSKFLQYHLNKKCIRIKTRGISTE